LGREGDWVEVQPGSYTVRRLTRAEIATLARQAPRSLPVDDPEAPPRRETPSPDGERFLGEVGHNLALRWGVDDRTEALTADGTAGRPWSAEEARWAPDGYRLAVRRQDLRGVHQVPLVHWLKPREEVEWIPVAKTGGRLPRTELHVLDTLSRETVALDTGAGRWGDEAYLHLLGWTGDGGEVLFLRMERRFDHLRLVAADPRTGASRVILEEGSETFLFGLRFEFHWPQLFTPLPGGDRFLWLSERDGWSHIYLYDLQGKVHRQLTHGDFPVLEVVAVEDGPEGWVYFLASADRQRPYDVHLYRVPLAGDGSAPPQQLSEAPGVHAVRMAPDRQAFLDTHSSPSRPPRTELWRIEEGGSAGVAMLGETPRAPLEALGWRPPEPFMALAADGSTPLHGLLFKPFDFDPGERYPVVDYIYNGPFATWTPRTFFSGVGLYAQALAQRGFVVVVVDGRGTPGRGKVFQDVVHGRFGQHEVADHAAVLRALAARRPYLDLHRVGIIGGSWGGYFVLRALLTEPELFRVGVALNPVVDLIDHNATAIEGYMGLPQDNPEGYAAASNLALAAQLQGELMVLHSTADRNATFSATMKLAHVLMTAGKHFRLVVLPEASHTPRGLAQEYWLEAQRLFLEEHLLEPPAANLKSGPFHAP
jgi:dipeptidyl aminopeptidase/acylaminoacyl peptidase